MADGIPPDFSKEELLRRIDGRWLKLQELLSALTADEWEQPLGDGWPAKVHVGHLAAWERSALGILNSGSRPEAMGVPVEIWERHDTDEINDYLATDAMKLDATTVREELDEAHAAIVSRLSEMAEEELLKPYSHYQPDGPHNDKPVVGWIVGNTFGHFDEHIEWLEAGIATSKAE
jgi:hypothetical protein